LPDFEEASLAVTIAVAPVRLRQAAATVRVVGERLLRVRGQLGPAAAGLDPALGGAAAHGAFASLWRSWTDSVEGLAGDAVALAAALEAAAEAYERTDQHAVPADRDGEGADRHAVAAGRDGARAGWGGLDAPAR
jgi:uncharacterized protein YukE